MEDNSLLNRLMKAANVEPPLPGVIPPEPEQHRFPGMEREAQSKEQAAPERTNGNAQFLREEDRTRPMPRPTLSMPGMEFYVGPVYPLRGPEFSPEAWGQQRSTERGQAEAPASQATPEIKDGSVTDRLLIKLRSAAENRTTEAQRPQQEQGLPAIDRGDQARAKPETDQLHSARDRMAELMGRQEVRQGSQDIEAQLQAAQQGREAHRITRGF